MTTLTGVLVTGHGVSARAELIQPLVTTPWGSHRGDHTVVITPWGSHRGDHTAPNPLPAPGNPMLGVGGIHAHLPRPAARRAGAGQGRHRCGRRQADPRRRSRDGRGIYRSVFCRGIDPRTGTTIPGIRIPARSHP